MSQLYVGVLEATQPGVRVGEVTMGAGLHDRVGQPLGGGHSRVLGGDLVVPVAPPVEEGPERPGQLARVGVETGGAGTVDHGQQHGLLGGEPFEGPHVVGRLFRSDSGLGRGQGEQDPVRVQQPAGGVGRVQVVVEHPVRGGAALAVRIDAVGKVRRKGAQQVMEGVPAGDRLDEQVRVDQLGQQWPYLRYGQRGEAGRRRSGDVRTGMQAEQPEQPSGRRGQRQVGPGEHRPDIGVRVVEAVGAVAQLGGERVQGQPRAAGGAGGHDRQRQRKPGAALHDLVNRRRLGGDPVDAEAASQQLTCLGRREQIEGDRMGAIGGDQAGKLVAAGDHDQAAGGAG
jgi:hypothetical protein